jgi:hypothetical protein
VEPTSKAWKLGSGFPCKAIAIEQPVVASRPKMPKAIVGNIPPGVFTRLRRKPWLPVLRSSLLRRVDEAVDAVGQSLWRRTRNARRVSSDPSAGAYGRRAEALPPSLKLRRPTDLRRPKPTSVGKGRSLSGGWGEGGHAPGLRSRGYFRLRRRDEAASAESLGGVG